MTRKIGRGGKYDSLISSEQRKKAKDLKSALKSVNETRPKGIFSDIELLEERARNVLALDDDKDLEHYHSQSKQKECARKVLEHTEVLRCAIKNNDIQLAVSSSLRAAEQAERIILHHWEHPARVGQGALGPAYSLYGDSREGWEALARDLFFDPNVENRARRRKSRKWLAEQVRGATGDGFESIKDYFEEQDIPGKWEK